MLARIFLTSLLAVALVGCSGSGSSTNPASTTNPTPPVANQSVLGVWVGRSDSNVFSSASAFLAIALGLDDGSFVYQATDGKSVIAQLKLNISGDKSSGTGYIYYETGMPITVNFSKLITKNSIQGDYSYNLSTGGSDKGTLNFTYNSQITDYAPNWNLIAGNYQAYTSSGGWTYLKVKSDGSFAISDPSTISSYLLISTGQFSSTPNPGILKTDLSLVRYGSSTTTAVSGFGFYSGNNFYVYAKLNGQFWYCVMKRQLTFAP